VQGPVGPGSPEGRPPVTTSTKQGGLILRDVDGSQGQWSGEPIVVHWRVYPYAHRARYQDCHYTGEPQLIKNRRLGVAGSGKSFSHQRLPVGAFIPFSVGHHAVDATRLILDLFPQGQARGQGETVSNSSSTAQSSISRSGMELMHQSGGVALGGASSPGLVGEAC
jgi:hypothetical protein